MFLWFPVLTSVGMDKYNSLNTWVNARGPYLALRRSLRSSGQMSVAAGQSEASTQRIGIHSRNQCKPLLCCNSDIHAFICLAVLPTLPPPTSRKEPYYHDELSRQLHVLRMLGISPSPYTCLPGGGAKHCCGVYKQGTVPMTSRFALAPMLC